MVVVSCLDIRGVCVHQSGACSDKTVYRLTRIAHEEKARQVKIRDEFQNLYLELRCILKFVDKNPRKPTCQSFYQTWVRSQQFVRPVDDTRKIYESLVFQSLPKSLSHFFCQRSRYDCTSVGT